MASHPLGLDLSLFPIRGNLTYLNHAGTSPIAKPAADRLKQFADEVSGHASSIYPRWTAELEATRERIARLLGAHADEVAFGKSTTAGLNLVALGLQWKPGDVVIVEERTFPANYIGWRDIAVQRGARLWTWPERGVRYELEDLEKRLREGGVRLVAATTANFATGFRQDMEAVGRLCHQHGALHCVDAIQTLGVYPLDVRACAIDFLSADSHKWLMGPESAGLFYCAKDRLGLLDPALVGWMGRENFGQYDRLDLPPAPTARRFEEGSPNVAGSLAMGEGIRLLMETGIPRIAAHNGALCQVLIDGLAAMGWEVATPREAARRASIVAARHPGKDPQAVVTALWEKHRIWAAARRGMVRLSPHFYQDAGDMERVLAAMASV